MPSVITVSNVIFVFVMMKSEIISSLPDLTIKVCCGDASHAAFNRAGIKAFALPEASVLTLAIKLTPALSR